MSRTTTSRAAAMLAATATAAALAGLPATTAAAATPPALPFDLNGDGRADVVIGVPTWDDGGAAVGDPARVVDSGAVLVLWGGRNRVEETLVTQAGAAVPGEPAGGDGFGSAVASADFDRDGYADLAVGAPGDEAQQTSDGTGSGSVTVLYGGPGGLTERAEQVLPGSHASFGAALVAADLTGDGHPDLAVGSPGDDPEPGGHGSGSVVVLRGGPAGFALARSHDVPRPAPDTAAFGSVLAAGDTDADGDVDLVEGYGGRMRWDADTPAVFGHSSYLDGKPGGPTTARPLGGRNASSLAVGDVTGDGVDDVVVGTAVASPYRAGATRVPRGWVTLFRGSATGPVPADKVTQDSPGVPGRERRTGDRFGAGVDLTDIDRDGRLDVLVGVPGASGGAGRVTVLRGATDGFATRHNVHLSQGRNGIVGRAESGDRFGAETSVRDVTGDGRADLVIGSPGENRGRGTVTIVQLEGIFYVPAGVRSYSLGSLDRADGGAPKGFGSVLG